MIASASTERPSSLVTTTCTAIRRPWSCSLVSRASSAAAATARSTWPFVGSRMRRRAGAGWGAAGVVGDTAGAGSDTVIGAARSAGRSDRRRPPTLEDRFGGAGAVSTDTWLTMVSSPTTARAVSSWVIAAGVTAPLAGVAGAPVEGAVVCVADVNCSNQRLRSSSAVASTRRSSAWSTVSSWRATLTSTPSSVAKKPPIPPRRIRSAATPSRAGRAPAARPRLRRRTWRHGTSRPTCRQLLTANALRSSSDLEASRSICPTTSTSRWSPISSYDTTATVGAADLRHPAQRRTQDRRADDDQRDAAAGGLVVGGE